MRPALAAVLLLVLAGCAEDPPGPAPATTDTTTSSTDLPEPGPSLVATPMSQPIAWSGHTKEGVWVCSDDTGTGQCPAGSQVAPDGAFLTTVAYAGGLTGLDANLTWAPAPGQGDLVIAALGNTSTGFAPWAWARGPSPLRLQATAGEGAGFVPDGVVVFQVWPAGKTATQPSFFVDLTQQSFSLDGTLRSVQVVMDA